MRGGPRPGAGRPRKDGPKLSEVRGLRVADVPATLARLEAVAPGKSRGEQILEALRLAESCRVCPPGAAYAPVGWREFIEEEAAKAAKE